MKTVAKSDYAIIKSKYGEKFARLCRDTFPTILETPGALAQIITEHFAPTHSLADDLADHQTFTNFKNYVYGVFGRPHNTLVTTTLTPEQLMAQAGYTLFPECKTEADVQKFKKFYTKREKLCTFNGNRLRFCRVWFAVKNNVHAIRREDFPVPQRQDAYGTSVISIQFSKGLKQQTLSIKNRYNHTVANPDATFSNNLDNIIPGLTYAFQQHYHCYDNTSENRIEIPHYLQANDGKFYRENFEENLRSYCENNVMIINQCPIAFDSHSQILADNYLFDLQKNQVIDLSVPYYMGDAATIKNIKQLMQACLLYHDDGFTRSLGEIDRMTVQKATNHPGKVITVYSNDNPEPKIIELDQHHQIISYRNHEMTSAGCYFLAFNRALTHLDTPNLTETRGYFLDHNQALTQLNLPKLKKCKSGFLYSNRILQTFNAPELTTICGSAFNANQALTPETFHVPQLTQWDVDINEERQWIPVLGENPNFYAIASKIIAQQDRLAAATTRTI